MFSMHSCRSSLTRSIGTCAALFFLFITASARAQDYPPMADDYPPMANDDFDMTESDVPVGIDVLANDFGLSAPLDAGSVTILAPPQYGTASVDPQTGIIEFIPDAGVQVTDSLLYEVSDTEGRVSNAAFVWIMIYHDPPFAADDWESTLYNESVVVDVLANDTGGTAAIDPGSVRIVEAPSNGCAVVDPATGAVNYLPDSMFSGSDSFSYVVDDVVGVSSSPARVEIMVMNDPPQISSFIAWMDSYGIWVFEGLVTDEHPETVTISFGGLIQGTMHPDASGYFSTTADLAPGTFGAGTATATDEAGAVYGPVYADVYPY